MRKIIASIAALYLAPQIVPSVVLAQAAPDRSVPTICLESGEARGDTLLRNRIGPADPAVLEMFAGAGSAEIAEHHLSENELVVIDRALRESPFVSFYATAAAPEDLAELVAWQQLASRFDQALTLTIRDREGNTVYRYEPLASPHVRPRFAEVEGLLERYEGECLPVTG